MTELYQHYVGPDNTWMDFVGRQETLKKDLIQALRTAGEDIDAKRVGKLKKMNVGAGSVIGERAIASEAMIERVEAVEHWVLDTFYAT